MKRSFISKLLISICFIFCMLMLSGCTNNPQVSPPESSTEKSHNVVINQKITFDMDKNDIISLEGNDGRKMTSWDARMASFNYANNEVYDNMLGYDWDSFAGYKDVVADYFFNSSDKLSSLVIELSEATDYNQDNDYEDSKYSSLKESLSSKYGAPISIDKIEDYSPGAYDAAAVISSATFFDYADPKTYWGASTKIMRSAQWLIEDKKDCYISIILLEYERDKQYLMESKKHHGVILSYSLCPTEYINTLIKQVSDLYNDV